MGFVWGAPEDLQDNTHNVVVVAVDLVQHYEVKAVAVADGNVLGL